MDYCPRCDDLLCRSCGSCPTCDPCVCLPEDARMPEEVIRISGPDAEWLAALCRGKGWPAIVVPRPGGDG